MEALIARRSFAPCARRMEKGTRRPMRVLTGAVLEPHLFPERKLHSRVELSRWHRLVFQQ